MAVQGKVDKGEEIFLNEKEIKPKKYISTDESLWYLDNGVSNHMTGIRTHFKEIDGKFSGRIRFGDGSYVEIKGRGSILLECKNKEQRVIPNVYYIPKLKSNILSLGQLTETGVWRDFIISKNHTSSSRIIDEINTQDSERNDEDSAPSPTQNNTYEYMSDGDVFEQPIDNPSTPPPYTYEPNSEESTRYTSSTASSIRPFDHTPVQGYKNISKIYARAPEVQSDELLLLEEEPRNYKEVAQDKKWIKAMQIEIDSINKNKTWKLTTLPDK
ncbi:zinc finger, CCHC-type containing protein [Tanacetum coccineum]